MLRIIVPAVVLGTPEFRDIVEYGAVVPALRVVPLGFQTILQFLPPTHLGATITKTLLFVTCILAMTGFFTRVSLVMAACHAHAIASVQIVNILVDPIKASLGISDTQYSLLQGAALGLLAVGIALMAAFAAYQVTWLKNDALVANDQLASAQKQLSAGR